MDLFKSIPLSFLMISNNFGFGFPHTSKNELKPKWGYNLVFFLKHNSRMQPTKKRE
jgi:hypothetical protein